MKISVIVCTRNRAHSLDRTLAALFAQRRAGAYEREVVVVDNSSSDDTRAVVERYAAAYAGEVHYHFEGRLGLSRARNAGIAAAGGDLLAFTDDDVLVSANWLDEIHREFSADPALHALGGRVLPARAGLQRVAIQPSTERQTFTFPHNGDFVMGANMAFQHTVFERVGRFDVRLGAGSFFCGGEEVEMLYRAMKAGYRVLYAPNVLVHHDHDRVNVEQSARLEYGYGKGFSAYLMKHALRGDLQAVRILYWGAMNLYPRWRSANESSDDVIRRRRAQVRGIVVGLFTAPFVMGWPHHP